jgi:glycosyltransferase involved in cell wall biosynthesis
LTIHDLSFLRVPDAAYPTLRAYLEVAVPRSARRASHLIAVSESTRRDIIELLGIPEERVTAVPEGVGPEFYPDEGEIARSLLAPLGVPARFILSVGTLEPRKNYPRLLEAYSLLRRRGVPYPLVIAGRPGWLYEPIFERLVELRLGDHVCFLQPDDAELRALYSCTEMLVYPSLYEGFGIPPLEALACGAVVACSATSSLPEVVGDAALTFDPYDIDAIAAVMERALGDVELRKTLRQAGPGRAASFSWERTAEETARVYRQVAGGA